MMCTIVLHGGVCHRTSTPRKSGNKMKEEKKKTEFGHASQSESKCDQRDQTGIISAKKVSTNHCWHTRSYIFVETFLSEISPV